MLLCVRYKLTETYSSICIIISKHLFRAILRL